MLAQQSLWRSLLTHTVNTSTIKRFWFKWKIDIEAPLDPFYWNLQLRKKLNIRLPKCNIHHCMLHQELILVPTEVFITNVCFTRNMNDVPEDWLFIDDLRRGKCKTLSVRQPMMPLPFRMCNLLLFLPASCG